MTEPTLAERGRAGAAEMERRLRPLLLDQPPRHQRVLVAALERGAAARYRGWAETAKSDAEREAILACAAREEEIADRALALVPDAPDAGEILGPLLPDLRAAYDAVFRDRSREEQMAIQAHAERVGAGVWRLFAGEADAAEKATLEELARLEEASAEALEALLAL